MYCPQCKTEYRDGFGTCVDCGISLVHELQEELLEQSQGNSVIDKEVLLTRVSNEFECSAICALLKQEGIPVLKKYRGADSYLMLYMAGHNEPVEIYVPETLLEQAQCLIQVFADSENECSLDEEDVAAEKNWTKKSRDDMQYALFLLLVFVPIIVIALIVITSRN